MSLFITVDWSPGITFLPTAHKIQNKLMWTLVMQLCHITPETNFFSLILICFLLPKLPTPHLPLSVSHNYFSMFRSNCFNILVCKTEWSLCLSVSGLFHLTWCLPVLFVCFKWWNSFFLGLGDYFTVYIYHIFYPVIWRWFPWMIPYVGFWTWRCSYSLFNRMIILPLYIYQQWN